MTFGELVDTVRAESRQVARLWHPDATDPLIQAKNGSSIEVCTGKAAYQLTTGDIIEI